MLKKFHHSWKNFITDELKTELANIEKSIGNSYYPEKENVLRFLNTDYNNIKYVIVGMDPYPSSYLLGDKVVPEATGRSFEVASIESWCDNFKQQSLHNILKALYYNYTHCVRSHDFICAEIKYKRFLIEEVHAWFDSLEKQGVLFLNATLTVKPEVPGSHTKIWTNFMNELILFIDKKNPTWLLWGNNARDRVCPLIGDNFIFSVHPRIAKFVQENPFQFIHDVNWLGI